MIPTYCRPDLIRAAVMQWLLQTRQPDVICVHQNGSSESYEWAIADLRGLGNIQWIHTPDVLPQHQWYTVPLNALLAAGCTHFFWGDHDDMYLTHHVARCLTELVDHDFTVSNVCGVLYSRHDAYRYVPRSHFVVHAPGGMSSSMAFNRAFAEALAQDLAQDTGHFYTDNVVAKVTMPRFRCFTSERQTTIYVSHQGSVTSAGWLEGALAHPH